MISLCCLRSYAYPAINFWMAEPIFMKLGMYITEYEPISTTKLRGLSPQANYTDRATAACRRS
jgi:hypothetical protein